MHPAKEAPPQTLSFVILLRDVFRTAKLLLADAAKPVRKKKKNKILSEMVAEHFPFPFSYPKYLFRDRSSNLDHFLMESAYKSCSWGQLRAGRWAKGCKNTSSTEPFSDKCL